MPDRTITMSSLGKTFSITGWKIGWAIAPPALTAAVRSAHQFLTFAVARPLQHAAAEALTDPGARAWVEDLRRALLERRSLLSGTLTRLGFDIVPPDAGYFIMADHSAISDRLGIADDVEFIRRMTGEARVAAIPPSAFCVTPGLGRPWVRFAFCKNGGQLAEADRRLAAWLGGGR
jgi:N-succinyldiaminopimelate aminotransferase